MASGDTLVVFHPYNNEPPSADYASMDLRNQHPVLDFIPTGTSESAVFSSVMPQIYTNGGIDAYIHWSSDGLTTGTVIWDGYFERIGDGIQDVDSDGFASAQSITDTAPDTNGYVTIAKISFINGAQMDSVVAGEKFRFKVTRDTSGGSMAADAELHAVELREI